MTKISPEAVRDILLSPDTKPRLNGMAFPAKLLSKYALV